MEDRGQTLLLVYGHSMLFHTEQQHEHESKTLCSEDAFDRSPKIYTIV